jgi:hypothetical protein
MMTNNVLSLSLDRNRQQAPQMQHDRYTPSNKQDMMNDALVVYMHRIITKWGGQGRENIDIDIAMEWHEIPCEGTFTR